MTGLVTTIEDGIRSAPPPAPHDSFGGADTRRGRTFVVMTICWVFKGKQKRSPLKPALTPHMEWIKRLLRISALIPP